MEQFTHFSFSIGLPFFLKENFNFDEQQIRLVYQLIKYIPLISLVAAMVLIDRVQQLRNLKLFFLPIIAGLLMCLTNQFVVVLSGVCLLLLTGPFVQINVLVKLFTRVSRGSFFDDRIFLLLFLLISIFVGFSSVIYEILSHTFEPNLAFALPALVSWILVGLAFQLFYKPIKEISSASFMKINKRCMIVIGLATLVVFFYSFFQSSFTALRSNTGYSSIPSSWSEFIPYSYYFVAGIFFLFLPKFQTIDKTITFLILVIVVGIILLLTQSFLERSVLSVWSACFRSVQVVADVLIYPSLYALVLTTAGKYKKATALAFMFIGIRLMGLLISKFPELYFPGSIPLGMVVVVGVLIFTFRNRQNSRLKEPLEI